ncbi:MAG: ABC transporter permease [Tepidisphaeraceae bacterium]|jgi:molybdate transport system permease protein
MAGKKTIPPRHSWWLLILLALPLLALLVIPPFALLARTSPSTLLRYLGTPAVVQAIMLSLWTSAVSLLIVVAFGTPLAYILGRGAFVGKGILEAMIDWPIVLPPAVAGIALLMTLGRRGLIGAWLAGAGVQIPFTPIAVIIAQTFVAAPYYVKAASVGFSAISRDVLDSAALDGASPLRRFRNVTLPLAFRSVMVGGALTWSRALGEFGATIIFAGNYPGRTQTMPLAVYIGFEIDMHQALTLAAILLLISFGLLIGIRAAYSRG